MDHHADALHAAIDEVLAGHRDAFRHIVREHGLGVRGFIASQLYHLDDVDDLAHELEAQRSTRAIAANAEDDASAWRASKPARSRWSGERGCA